MELPGVWAIGATAIGVGELSSAIAVGVAGRVAALQAGLVRTQAAPVVPVREEPLVGGHPAARRVGIDLRHPGTHARREELVVPRAVERVRDVDAPAVPADLDHLRPTGQCLPGAAGCGVLRTTPPRWIAPTSRG